MDVKSKVLGVSISCGLGRKIFAGELRRYKKLLSLKKRVIKDYQMRHIMAFQEYKRVNKKTKKKDRQLAHDEALECMYQQLGTT